MTKRNLSIIIFALGLIAGAAWWFTLKPNQEAEITRLTEQLDRLQRDWSLRVQLLGTARNSIPGVRAELDELNAERAYYASRIPQQENLPQLLTNINALSDRHAVQYRGIQQGAKDELLPDIYQVTYTLTTLGQFNDQINFITDLQSLNRLIIVDAVNLGSSGSDPQRPMTNATITFRTFVNGNLTETDPEAEG